MFSWLMLFWFGKRPALHRISGVFGFGFTQASHNIGDRPERGTGEHRAKNVFKFGRQPLPIISVIVKALCAPTLFETTCCTFQDVKIDDRFCEPLKSVTSPKCSNEMISWSRFVVLDASGPKGQSRRARFASVCCIPSCRNNVVEVAADVGKFIGQDTYRGPFACFLAGGKVLVLHIFHRGHLLSVRGVFFALEKGESVACYSCGARSVCGYFHDVHARRT